MKHEDMGLVDAQFPALNKQFYSGDPHEYFVMRMNSLLLVVADSEHTRTAYREGLSFGTLNVKSDGDEDYDPRAARDYATVESLALLQHVCESLTRLYLAHRELPACPWLEMARSRDFGRFNAELERLRSEIPAGTHDESLRLVFRGSTDPASFGFSADDERWTQDLEALRSLMSTVLRTYLDQRVAYNATKHGLAVIAHELGLQINNDAVADLVVERNGPAVTFFELSQPPRKWRQTTQWVDADKNLGLAYLVAQQMRSLWNIAKMRYTGAEDLQTFPVQAEGLAEVSRPGSGNGVFFTSFSEELAYWAPDVAKPAPK